jgi:hypothetical protein
VQVILALSALLAAQTVSASEAPSRLSPSDAARQTLVENEPTAATRTFIAELINNSVKVEIYFTPAESMGRVGFSRELAEKRAKYFLEYRCHAGCGFELKELGRRLSTGRRLDGDCPRPISTVIYFSTKDRSRAESMYLAANGQCYSIRGNAYFLDKDNSIAELVGRLRNIFGQ